MKGEAVQLGRGRPVVRLWFCDFGMAESVDAIVAHNPVYQLLSTYFEVVLDAVAPDFLIYSCFMRGEGGRKAPRFRDFRCPRIFYTGENRPPDFMECDFAFSFLPDGERNSYLPLFLLAPALAALRAPRDAVALAAEKSRFCNFIYANAGCRVRNEFFRLLNERRPVDALGPLFNNTPGLNDRRCADWDKTKLPVMRRYKFSIAFENEGCPGYVTEKIVDAFAAGTVPIYWGCPRVAREFNAAAFIHAREFGSLRELAEYVIRVDEDEALYASFLAAAPVLAAGGTTVEGAVARFGEIFGGDGDGGALAAERGYSRGLARLPDWAAYRVVKWRRWWVKKRVGGWWFFWGGV